jgi:hypothetical protein
MNNKSREKRRKLVIVYRLTFIVPLGIVTVDDGRNPFVYVIRQKKMV